MRSYIRTDARILAAASVVGRKEHEGPLKDCFDLYDTSDKFGQKTWESAESEMQRRALAEVLQLSGVAGESIGALFAGDLLNQCVGSSYGLSDAGIPYFGLYGACSAAVEGLMLASVFVTHGLCDYAAAVTSSHNSSAERQYRNPLEYGAQRAPTAQWTATAAGAFLVGSGGAVLTNGGIERKENYSVKICDILPGIVRDRGIKDAANMGAAMCPAALDTLVRYFSLTGTSPVDYDLIVTGDLGYEGSALLRDLIGREGYALCENYTDCGVLLFDREKQDTHSGGSGCGCSAAVLASYLLPKMRSGEIRNMLLLGTGAMMSPSSLQQGQSIPAIAHLIHLRADEKTQWKEETRI